MLLDAKAFVARRSVELLGEPLRWTLAGCLMATAATADSFLVGTWLSLVEHSLGVRGVGSSNLPVPTISSPLLLGFFASLRRLASASHFPNYAVIVTLSSDSTTRRFASCRTWE